MRGALPITLLAAVLLIATPGLAKWGMPEGVGERMDTINGIYDQLMIMSVVVFLFVMGWMLVTIIRFRPGGSGQKTNEAHRGSMKAEVVWTVIPLLIVSYIGVIAYDGLLEVRPTAEDYGGDVEEITVTGFQWFWEAEYDNGVTLSPKPGAQGQTDQMEPLLIPANTPIQFTIESGDVIHSLWIPDLGVKMDAVPQKTNAVVFEAPEGEYFAQCAEFCQGAHAYMRTVFKAVPMQTYQDWLETQKAEQRSQGRLITVTDSGVEPAEIQTVAEANFSYLVQNAGSSTVEASFANATTGPIEPGAFAWLNTTAPPAGTHELTVGERTITVNAIEPEVVDVELTDFAIGPERIELTAGTGYVFNVVNNGNTVHNFYVGMPEEEGDSDQIIWQSIDLQPGEETQVLALPGGDQVGTHTTWCNIPGHYDLGMVGELVVQS